ncbi:MAG: hypothetical protein ACOC0J_01155 [Myxococcota bacterium]
MTVQITTTTITYDYDGTTEEFAVPFKFYRTGDSANLIVTRLYGDSNEDEEVLVEDTDYTVEGDYTVKGEGLPAGEGLVTLVGSPLSAGEQLFIARQTPRLQKTDFRSQGRFLPEDHEDAHDRAVMMIQEIEDEDNPTVTVEASDDAPEDLVEPGSAAAGTDPAFSRADHAHEHGNLTGGSHHAVATAAAHGFFDKDNVAPLEALTDGSNADSYHTHDGLGLSTDTPQEIGTAAAGTSTDASPSDHIHAHGDQDGGTLHAEASAAAAGFLGTDDYDKLQNIETGSTSTSVGDGASIDADSSTAFGANTAAGAGGTAVGAMADASAATATAVGNGTTASAAGATAVGDGATAAHEGATAVGEDATTTEADQIALGSSAAPKKVRAWDSYQGTHLIVDAEEIALDASAGDEEILLVTPSGGNIEITLPELSGVSFGRRYFVKNLSTVDGEYVVLNCYAAAETFLESGDTYVKLQAKAGAIITKGSTDQWVIIASYGAVT